MNQIKLQITGISPQKTDEIYVNAVLLIKNEALRKKLTKFEPTDEDLESVFKTCKSLLGF